MNPLVSVIITTYKRADMLGRAIESVLKQTYKPIEIIVVDDNGNVSEYRKQTEKVMSRYLSNPNIYYIKHEINRNGAAARNTGIKNSKGQIITFLDDDDWYYSRKVEEQVDFLLNNNQYQGVYCGWLREGEECIPNFEGNISFELLSGEALIYTNSIMIWKKYILDIDGWDEKFVRYQEAAFLLRFFKSGFKMGVVKKVLFEFDISDRSNALNSRRNEDIVTFYLAEHKSIIEKFPLKQQKIIYSWRYRGVMLSYLKNLQFYEAFRIYIKMMSLIPIRFNYDLIRYFFRRVRKN